MKKHLFIVMFFASLFSCSQEEIINPENQSINNRAVIKYTLCHYSADDESFFKLELPEKAFDTHMLNHDEDRIPNDTVTIDQVLYTLTSSCELCIVKNNCDSILLEEFDITFKNSFSRFTSPTQLGEQYVLIVEGVYHYSFTRYVDSAYGISPVEGEFWNGHSGRIGWNGSYVYRPNPDVYDGLNHRYTYIFTGDGTEQHFTFEDCCYWDNGGLLHLKLYHLPNCESSC